MRLLTIVFCLFCFVGLGQNEPVKKKGLTLEKVKKIYIIDQLNFNYDKVYSYSYKIEISDKDSLWLVDTQIMGQLEFHQDYDTLFFQKLIKKYKEAKKNGETIDLVSYRKENDVHFQKYLDTITEIKEKLIPRSLLTDLITNLTKITPKHKFEEKYSKEELKDLDLTTMNFSIYPSVTILIELNQGDTLVLHSDCQGKLVLPWKCKFFDKKFENYNTNFNRILYAILPEKKNRNRDRLIYGLK